MLLAAAVTAAFESIFADQETRSIAGFTFSRAQPVYLTTVLTAITSGLIALCVLRDIAVSKKGKVRHPCQHFASLVSAL